MVSQIYLPELQLNTANTSDSDAAFLDLHLSISNDIVSTTIYDKRYDFYFEIVNYPFLDGDVPRSTFYGVYISQLIRFARASSHVAGFNIRNKLLSQKLLKQGFRYHTICKTFSRFIDDTMIWYLNCKLYLNPNNFAAQFIELTSQYKRLAITLMYGNRLHAWWSTQ